MFRVVHGLMGVVLDDKFNFAPSENSVTLLSTEKSFKFSSGLVLFGIISAIPNPESPAAIKENAIRVTILADKNASHYFSQLDHNYY